MNIEEYWKRFDPVSSYWKFTIALVYLIIAAAALCNNVMVGYYLLKNKKKGQSRHDSLFFLINLTTADLLMICVNGPMTISSNFYGSWLFGKIGCTFYGVVGGMSGFTSLITLTLMSIERYVIIKYPLKVFNDYNKLRAACIALTWIYAAFWTMCPFLTENGYVLEGFQTSCSFDYLSRDIKTRVLNMAMLFGGFLAPIGVFATFCFLTKRSVNENKKSTICSHFSKMHLIRKSTILIRSTFNKRDVQVFKKIIINISLFCIAWTPYAIITLIAQYSSVDSVDKYVTPFTTSLPALFAKSSAIYNPMVYTLSNRKCRDFYKKLLSRPSGVRTREETKATTNPPPSE